MRKLTLLLLRFGVSRSEMSYTEVKDNLKEMTDVFVVWVHGHLSYSNKVPQFVAWLINRGRIIKLLIEIQYPSPKPSTRVILSKVKTKRLNAIVCKMSGRQIGVFLCPEPTHILGLCHLRCSESLKSFRDFSLCRYNFRNSILCQKFEGHHSSRLWRFTELNVISALNSAHGTASLQRKRSKNHFPHMKR